MASTNEINALNHKIVTCRRCPRLRAHCENIAVVKKREFREWTYWGKPIPGFGDSQGRLWIIGLAPAAHGANRTGRMFTGDSSGQWLYRALYRMGFCNQDTSTSIDDGLQLREVYISASARCAPPENKPLPVEIANCAPYLDEEYRLLPNAHLLLALGAIGFRTCLDLLQKHQVSLPTPRPQFFHGAYYDFGEKQILASYHPSRQNTQTGKLTQSMWDKIFERAKEYLKNHASGKGQLVRTFQTNELDVPSAL